MRLGVQIDRPLIICIYPPWGEIKHTHMMLKKRKTQYVDVTVYKIACCVDIDSFTGASSEIESDARRTNDVDILQ